MNVRPELATLRVTFSGTPFSLAHPDPQNVNPLDIAVALSRLPRWGGHCLTDYVVAQHAVLAADSVPPAFALAALLHDAAEAYTGDIPRPLRVLLGPVLDEIEARINAAICQRFSLADLMPPEVRAIDERLLATEQRDLLTPAERLSAAQPFATRIFPWKRRASLIAFVDRFETLSGELIDRRQLPKKRKHVLGRWPALAG